MTRGLEFVTKLTVEMRHPGDYWAPMIDRFFYDAGDNIVNAFWDERRGVGGYMFFEEAVNGLRKYHQLITTCNVQIMNGNMTAEDPLLLPELRRQETFQWRTGFLQEPNPSVQQ